MVNKILRPANVFYLPVIVRKNVLPVALLLSVKKKNDYKHDFRDMGVLYIKQNYISV